MSFGIPSDLDIPWVRTPGTLSGSLRFRGTRVFARSLFDNLAVAGNLDGFLDDYPTVSREDALKGIFAAGVLVESLPQGNPVRAEDDAGWTRDPEVMGGEPVFAGTRVLVVSLFDELEGGGTIYTFVKDNPEVTWGAAQLVLRTAGHSFRTRGAELDESVRS